MWNLPNALTMLRIFMAPLLVVVLLTEIPDKEIWGLVIFLLAALTDLFVPDLDCWIGDLIRGEGRNWFQTHSIF